MTPTLCRKLISLAVAAVAATALPVHAEKVGKYHVMPMPEQREALAAQAQAGAATTTELYYGGSVFSNVKVVSVMWGSNVSSTISKAIPGFSKALVNSTFVDQMAQYDTVGITGVNGQPGTNQQIKRGTYLGQKVITPKNTNKTLSDTDIQNELLYQISAGALPANDLNTLYMIYFPSSIKITLDGSTSCVGFGAYHEAVYSQVNANNVFYSVEPDCRLGLTNITIAASHEFVEAMTDNIPTPGSNPAYPQAWNTSTGYEVADLCSGSGKLTSGTKSWTVTQYFLNSTHACSKGNYVSP